MNQEPFDTVKLKVNSAEVSEVFTCTLKDLCDPRNQGYTQFRSGYVIPVYFGQPVEAGVKSMMPKIWGLTAGITHQVLTVLVPKMYKLKLRILPKITVKT